MLDRLEQSPEVVKATDQMTGVLRDFFRDDAIPRELVEFAVCELMRLLREKRWAVSQVLAFCRNLINAQAARVGHASTTERQAWLDEQLGTWLLRCGGR